MTAVQRRKKSNKSKDNTSSSESSSTKVPPGLQDQVDKALNSLLVTKNRTALLHSQWRAHLLRLSYLISIVCMHQCLQPAQDCLQDIKSINNSTSSDDPIVSGWRAVQLVFGNSFCEILNVFISLCLFKFLSIKDPHGDFSKLSFMLSSTLIFVCLGAFFNMEPVGCERMVMAGVGGSDSHDSEAFLRNVGTADQMTNAENDSEEGSDGTARQFPVAVIFHAMVAVCYWFMKVGMEGCDRNIAMVQRLEDEAKRRRKANGSK